MTFTMTVNCDNAAFEGNDRAAELGDILRAVEGRLLGGDTSGICHDVNGNKVGTWSLE